ncbi:MAG: ABC transporter ATP-binding protein [Verrucomicrobiota bacterium]|jgi:iron complex transport system ATP-binding protein|nr:ABC transporter ATP-binding protein [Verrucomicrobiota bacterium]
MLKSDNPIIKLSNLTIQRDKIKILESINWQVNQGEHWVVIGGNGSGKTTLLSALTGYFAPTKGEIDLLGERYGQAHWPTLRKKIGLVSSSLRQMMADDEPALISVITGKYAMIDLWGRPKPSDCKEARKILRRIGCNYLADRLWSVLSQGERQRVLIGRSLMAKPKVLLLDEPCAGLDPAARENFLQFVDDLGQEKNAPTFVFVTHHIEEITSIYTHAILLRDGQVLDSGPIKKMLTSEKISAVFREKVRITRIDGRYRLKLTPATH